MRDRIAAWRHAFEEDDNAVLPTLVNFAWNFAAFQTIAKAVELAPANADGSKNLNFMMLNLLRGSYWGGAILAIRRLVDRGPLHGPVGVASLRSILGDVVACRLRLNRRVYLEDIAGLDYDYEDIERRAFEYLLAQPEGAAVWMPRELDDSSSRRRHEEFDYLSGTAPDQRLPNDLIRPEVFELLEARLQRVDQVADHATIYFAHASTEASRADRGIAEWGPADAKGAFQNLVQTAELIGRWFLYSGVGDVLPTPQYDQFAHMDEPLLQPVNLPALHAVWDGFAAETGEWPRIDDLALG